MTDSGARVDPRHHGGSPPARASARLTLAWGLVTIPAAVYAATEGSTSAVARKEYTPDGHPVGRQPYDKATGLPVDAADVVKKAAAADGTEVELTDDEMAAVTAGPRGTADIQSFVPLASLFDGTYGVEALNQLRPSHTQVGSRRVESPAAQKAFALLLDTMAAEGVAALVKVALRGPARYAALLPDGRLATLAWARQVRPSLPLPDVELGDAERAMGRQLLAAIGIATPVLEDADGDALQRFVDDKAAGAVDGPPPAAEPAPVADLTAALEASLAAAGSGGGRLRLVSGDA